MHSSGITFCLLMATQILAQNNRFELPIQLIGFPTIILAVRISNFLKKLSYAVSPSTYRSRSRRDLIENSPLDVIEVEKRLVAEMGENVCIYESVCEAYAHESIVKGEHNHIFDWEDIFAKYEDSPKNKRDFYLLSVFLGDIVGSPGLCRQLAKRGRTCETLKLDQDKLTKDKLQPPHRSPVNPHKAHFFDTEIQVSYPREVIPRLTDSHLMQRHISLPRAKGLYSTNYYDQEESETESHGHHFLSKPDAESTPQWHITDVKRQVGDHHSKQVQDSLPVLPKHEENQHHVTQHRVLHSSSMQPQPFRLHGNENSPPHPNQRDQQHETNHEIVKQPVYSHEAKPFTSRTFHSSITKQPIERA